MKRSTIALVGNPNVGKSTLFNRITGHQQKIGNWPGKTVEIKEGKNKITDDGITFIDLPGVYSIEANSPEERVANDYIEKKKPDCTIQVIDSTNLERNLYLTTQLLEKDLNLILALNMTDKAERKGICIDEKKLSALLGVKAIKISSKKGIGVKELITQCSKIDDIEDSKKDKKILEELGLKAKSLSPKHRYDVISRVASLVLKKPRCIKSRSAQIDKIVAHPILGLPIFLFVMWLVFQASFSLAEPFTALLEDSLASLSALSTELILSSGLPSIFASLISDGVIGGVGSVLVFLPNILLLFLFLLILEDSGYFARIAMITDSLMQKIGLEGKAFIPLVLGFGCNVPAIMATKVLEDERERLITILINPFMSCSARFPIYVLFAGTFFASDQGLVILSLYLIGIFMAILSAFLLRRMLFKKSAPPSLLIELPPYRVPTFCTIARQTYFKGLLFVKKAGMFILSISLLIWFLASMPLGVEYASEQSLIGSIGKLIAPALAPCGFGQWEPTVALMFGAGAKEVVVSSLGTLYGAGEEGLSSAISTHFTPLSAYSFMLFSLLYMPCFAAIAAIRKESGDAKWAIFTVLYTTSIAWTVSTLFYQLAIFFGFA